MNAAKIARLNAQTKTNGRGATYGFTKFSDMSVVEFKSMNGFIPKNPLNKDAKVGLTAPSGAIDWVAKGMTTPVKDQGQCGSW